MQKSKSFLVKLLTMVLTLCCAMAVVFGVAGCSDEKKSYSYVNDKGELVFVLEDGTEKVVSTVDKLCAHKNIVSMQSVNRKDCVRYNAGQWEGLADALEGKFCSATIAFCKDCDAMVVLDKVITHNYETKTYAATCTEGGYDGKTCKDCAFIAEKSNQTEALGHTEVVEEVIIYDDTNKNVCENGGYKVTRCSVCEETLATEAILASVHHSDDWELGKAPSADEAGYLVGNCNVCMKTGAHYDLPKLSKAEGSAYTYALNNEERENVNKDRYEYSITVDEQTFAFAEELDHILGKLNILGGAEINDYSAEKYVGFKLFGNGAEITCKGDGAYADAYFTCDACGDDIIVHVKKAHTEKADSRSYSVETDCSVDGVYTYECSVCGDTGIEAKETKFGHKIKYEIRNVTPGTGDKEGKTFADIFEVCDREKSENVQMDSYEKKIANQVEVTVAETPATCTKEGKKVYTYVQDGETLTLEETIDKINHAGKFADGTATLINDKLPLNYGEYDLKYFGNEEIGCGEAGSAYFVCTVCNDEIGVRVIKEHVRPTTEGSVTYTAPTCTQKGSYVYDCAKCGADCTDYVDAVKHDYVWTITTGTQEGTQKWTGICQTKYKDNKIDATGTDACVEADCTLVFDNVTSTLIDKKDATCTAKGYNKYELVNGEDKYYAQVSVDEIPHVTAGGKDIIETKVYPVGTTDLKVLGNKPADCKTNGEGYFTCKECNGDIKVATTGAHTGKVKVADVAANCIEAAHTTYNCTTCDITDASIKEYVAGSTKLGHNYKITIDVEPGKTTTGKATITCDRENCPSAINVEVELPKLEKEAGVANLNTADYKLGYDAITINEATCLAAYTAVCQLDGKNGSETVEIKFTVVIGDKDDHDFTDVEGKAPLFWTVRNTVGEGESAVTTEYKYTAKYCKDCQRYIITNIVSEVIPNPVA